MNNSKIDWCDYTWNPVTGCWGPGGTADKPNRCSYCYAEKIAWRFYRHHSPAVDLFEPRFHPERLSEPGRAKKPSRIFVCSMGDLFGDWVPQTWILNVRGEAILNPRHTFIFLTKNPKRYLEFGPDPWPENCWLGTTITNQSDANTRIPDLLKAQAKVLFVSAEPLLGGVDIWTWFTPRSMCGSEKDRGVDWLIIGAMTGPGAVKPEPDWVQALIKQGVAASVPVFAKDNLNLPPHLKIQEFPQV